MKTTILAIPLLCLASAASANEFEPAMRGYLAAEIAAWQNDPIIIAAIRAQNAKTAAIPQSQIDALDIAWRAEVGAVDTPTIAPVLSNPAAEFLRARVADAGGRITEAFVMDSRGLNVATSNVTSDYWQGDEAKFTETYPKGSGAVHIGEVELDESSQTYQGQVSVVIVDPATGAPIGAMTIGLNAAAL
ncbi:MAG: hypothetical protein WBN04_21670 [Paracoccaceae bacterium]